jgi:S1-C subfamily serine protease
MRKWYILFATVLLVFSTDANAENLPRRASLGVALLAVDDSVATVHGLECGKGVLVSRVVENSSAEDLGIKVGDVILQFNDEEVVNVSRLVARIGRQQEGDLARVQVSRNGQKVWLEGVLKGAEKENHSVAEVKYNAFVLKADTCGP